MSNLVFAQFSDCHLYGDKGAIHFGHNVYQNLLRVVTDIGNDKTIQFAIFTGDLSQDHSDMSYRNFVDAIEESGISIPIFWLPGNHDSLKQMNTLLRHPLIRDDKTIDSRGLQLVLLNSKSDTPAGRLSPAELAKVKTVAKPTLIMLHHHPLPVNYFIDRHILQNRTEFWQAVNTAPEVIGVACGHIHRGLTIVANKINHAPLYGCPATSIQFDPDFDGVKPLAQGPAYRQFFYRDKTLSSEIKRLPFDVQADI